MTGASKTFDPVAAAEAEIAGSKDLIAAVARDLTQHERWLAHYQLAEKRYARRLMLKALIARLDAARVHVVQVLRRIMLRGLRLARDMGNFLWREITALAALLNDALAIAWAWLRPRLIALALVLRAWLANAWIWIVATSRGVEAAARRWCAAGWAWSAAEARRAAVITRRSFAAATAWGSAQAKLLALRSRDRLIALSVWTRSTARTAAAMLSAASASVSAWLAVRTKTTALAAEAQIRAGWRFAFRNGQTAALASIAAASAARHWAEREIRTLALARRRADFIAVSRKQAQALRNASLAFASSGYAFAANKLGLTRSESRASPKFGANHRALAIRRSTALVCVEPSRSRPPALLPS